MSSDETLRVTYSLTEEDVDRFLLYHSRHNRLRRWDLLLLWLFVMGMSAPLATGVVDRYGKAIGFLGLVLVASVFTFIFWVLTPGMYRNRNRSLLGTLGQQHVEISSAGLFVANPAREVTRRWYDIPQVIDTPTDVILYISLRGPKYSLTMPYVVFVPRQAFPTAEAAERFLRAAQEWQTATKRTIFPSAWAK